MFLTVRRALAAAGVSFAELRVGALGFGSIGRATWELCRLRLGEPAAFVAVDPRLAGGAWPAALCRCDLISAPPAAERPSTSRRWLPAPS